MCFENLNAKWCVWYDIFIIHFFKTENTPSKNEVLYKIKFIVKKIRFEKKKKRFQNRMSNRHKSICLFTSREITCFSCKPKILVPNYLEKKKKGENIY